MTEIISGYAMHVHHNYLVEWCYLKERMLI